MTPKPGKRERDAFRLASEAVKLGSVPDPAHVALLDARQVNVIDGLRVGTTYAPMPVPNGGGAKRKQTANNRIHIGSGGTAHAWDWNPSRKPTATDTVNVKRDDGTYSLQTCREGYRGQRALDGRLRAAQPDANFGGMRGTRRP